MALVRPPIEPMDQPGDKFLAGAALAGEENGGLREGCHLDDLAQDGDPSGAIANESVPDLIRSQETVYFSPALETRCDGAHRRVMVVPPDDVGRPRTEARTTRQRANVAPGSAIASTRWRPHVSAILSSSKTSPVK